LKWNRGKEKEIEIERKEKKTWEGKIIILKYLIRKVNRKQSMEPSL
jgi:hypothetical protein